MRNLTDSVGRIRICDIWHDGLQQSRDQCYKSVYASCRFGKPDAAPVSAPIIWPPNRRARGVGLIDASRTG
ncbi:MAG: hypothetical protein AMJ62_05380 [Myxococcales bacterium SG8_38]|nr:MAG: hypothetical protein AMJ62_05380 [Myxococcales bacterium SG8_38]